MTSGKTHLANGTPVNGLDYAWTYDDIGNRKTATTNSQVSNYSANLLNQYSSRVIPGYVDVLGEAEAGATVTVALNNGTSQSTTRQGDWYYRQLAVNNTSGDQSPTLKITGVKNNVGPNSEDAVTEITKNPFLPKTPEVFTHDLDGNLKSDARWTYTWDAENRLIAMTPVGGALRPDSVRLEFTYDGQSRRIAKNVYNWNGSVWVLGTSTRFLYDGWNMVAELSALSSNAVIRTYVWGIDLSGTSQGAGGVGGLLFSTLNSQPSTLSYAYDGNGNVIGLVEMATGAKSATYDYSAFGETIQSDGVASAANHFRFSTKYTDDETGLLYYGFRYYQPTMGRWPSRDPIEEGDGLNLHAFVKDSPLNYVDIDGKQAMTTAQSAPPALLAEFGLSRGTAIAITRVTVVTTVVAVNATDRSEERTPSVPDVKVLPKNECKEEMCRAVIKFQSRQVGAAYFAIYRCPSDGAFSAPMGPFYPRSAIPEELPRKALGL